jgi:hypothetical protein
MRLASLLCLHLALPCTRTSPIPQVAAREGTSEPACLLLGQALLNLVAIGPAARLAQLRLLFPVPIACEEVAWGTPGPISSPQHAQYFDTRWLVCQISFTHVVQLNSVHLLFVCPW